MRNKLLADLSPAAALSGTESWTGVQSGGMCKITPLLMSTYVSTALSLGTMSTQSAAAVNITGGDITTTAFSAITSTSRLTSFQGTAFDFASTNPSIGGISVDASTLSAPVLGDYGGSISFTRRGTNRRGAAIVAKQTGSDMAQLGIAFFTKGSTTVASHALSERLILDHVGTLYSAIDNNATIGSATNRWSVGYVNALKNGSSTIVAFGGIADPSYSQHNTGGSGATFALSRWVAATTPPQFILAKSRGATVGTFAAVLSGDSLSDVQAWGDNGTALAIGTQIRSTTTENWSGTANGSRLAFSTVAPTTTTLTEVARLDTATGLSMFGANPVIDSNRIFRTRPYTVATLPTVGTVDRLCSVSDASAPTWNATLVGGGAVRCLAYDNGTNWTAH